MATSEPVSAPKLLLVDDMPNNLIALEAVLQQDGYSTITAHSGEEALEILRVETVSLVLLDVQMPGMDGFETARKIKELKSCAELPIIFITAIHKEDPFVKMGYDAGAVDYFSKPFDPDILRMKVRIYASFRQRAQVLREREKQVAESEAVLRAGQKLSAVLESLPLGVIIADSAGRIAQTNEEVLRIWNSIGPGERDSYGEFLGWWDQEGQLIKGDGGPVHRVLESGQATHNEVLEIRCFDGSVKSILTSASPLRKLGGEIVGVVLVLQDMTEHKKIELELEERILGLVSQSLDLDAKPAADARVG